MKKKEMIFPLGIVNKLKTIVNKLIQFFFGGGGQIRFIVGDVKMANSLK